jgi:hypothetical protein
MLLNKSLILPICPNPSLIAQFKPALSTIPVFLDTPELREFIKFCVITKFIALKHILERKVK